MTTEQEQTQMQTQDVDAENVVVDEPVKKTTGKRKKVEYDDDGNVIKKLRMTNKTRYPNVKDVQPRTAYQFFIMEKSGENRDKITADPEHPKLKTKELSDQWKMIDDRTKWNDMAIEDKKRFYDAVRECGYEVKEKVKKPTRPCTAFLLYARSKQKEYRDEHGTSYPETLMILGKRWKDPMFEDERTPYIDEANKLKEQWNIEHGIGKKE
jgi:hypothetical protein